MGIKERSGGTKAGSKHFPKRRYKVKEKLAAVRSKVLVNLSGLLQFRKTNSERGEGPIGEFSFPEKRGKETPLKTAAQGTVAHRALADS